ncbi:MAG TPA: glycosyltransferase family 4 protein [Nitriliruptorales bacterium]|nr:glycosyltransferase family 4 protein [Nitriliruptorales bacterium]
MVEALVTTATPHTQDGTYALVVSLWQQHPELPVYVVASPGVDLPLDVTVLDAAEVSGETPYVVGEILDHENQTLFSLPFAIERLLTRHQTLAYVAPGCLVVRPFEELTKFLGSSRLVLASPVLGRELHTLTPHLHTLTRRRELISERVLGISRDAISTVLEWQEAVTETFFDPYQRRPADVLLGVLQKGVGDRQATVAGEGTITSWVDHAAIESGRAQGSSAAVVECDALVAVARRALTQAQDVEVEWQLLADNVHDSRPLEPMVQVIHDAVQRLWRESGQLTPCERFARDVRRVSDPLGIRWPAGSTQRFRDWLYDRNPRGLTRLAHLYWREHLFDDLPNPAVDPAPLQRWNDRHALDRFGADLFDPTVAPGQPRGDHDDDEPTGLRNAIQWRLNLMAGLLPGYERRLTRRRLGSDPGRKRGVAAPRRVEVRRQPSVYGRAPRELSVIGCFRSESGLGQAARASLAALKHLQRDFCYVDTSEMYPSRNAVDPELGDRSFGAFGDVNLLHSNADELLTLGYQVFRHRLAGRFNAAMWFWETADLPDRSRPAFDCVDELWVASEYLADVFGQYAKVPVKVIGLAAELPAPRRVDRSEFGLSPDEFVLLFVYDALSAHGRKNPEKTLDAYVKAFAPRGFEGTRFVLKVSNLNKFPASQARIRELASKTSTITVIDEYFPRSRVMDLMSVADVYVSLHAAEGFGLTLLEAMAVETPVICTAYSGNMDFTTDDNSWLVDFSMMKTHEQTGPYPPGSIWASPHLDSAVELMRHVSEHRDEVERKRQRARQDALGAASLERYARRLDKQLRRVL